MTRAESAPLSVAQGGAVFVAQGGIVTALDSATGAVRWSADLARLTGDRALEGQPVRLGRRGEALFAAAAGHVVCLAADTGALLWARALRVRGAPGTALLAG